MSSQRVRDSSGRPGCALLSDEEVERSIIVCMNCMKAAAAGGAAGELAVGDVRGLETLQDQ